MKILDDNRLFPADGQARSVAARLYETIRDLPILSPHGHTDPSWFADNQPFPDPASAPHPARPLHLPHALLAGSLARVPRHSRRSTAKSAPTHAKSGASSPSTTTSSAEPPPGSGSTTPSKTSSASPIASARKTPTSTTTSSLRNSRPRSSAPAPSYEQFNIEVLSTTDTPLDTLEYHKAIRDSGWKGRVIPAFRPDSVIDAEYAGFLGNIEKLGEITGEDIGTFKGYLNALRNRRAFFKTMGCTSTDHGHLTAQTADLDPATAESLYQRILSGRSVPEEQQIFQAQMLTEMAGMSVEDGLTMQLHPGSVRNHNRLVYEKFGRDKGADMPSPTEYVRALRPLLNKYGNDTRLTFILFTLDETAFSRELAPLAGHYPALKLGPPWWFHDSPEGMMRFRETATETAGFYNTVGFNDDTRAFLSIPARHDVARRIDCAFLGRLVAEHRLDEDEAFEVAQDLTVNLVRKAYKL